MVSSFIVYSLAFRLSSICWAKTVWYIIFFSIWFKIVKTLSITFSNSHSLNYTPILFFNCRQYWRFFISKLSFPRQNHIPMLSINFFALAPSPPPGKPRFSLKFWHTFWNSTIFYSSPEYIFNREVANFSGKAYFIEIKKRFIIVSQGHINIYFMTIMMCQIFIYYGKMIFVVLIFLNNHSKSIKRGSRGAARAAKSLRWRV